MAALVRSSRCFVQKLLKHNVSATSVASVRHLNLQEYQSKKLMQECGVNVQDFRIASNAGDADDISKSFKVNEYVIKAQILAGGRGKGTFSNGFKSGVHLTKDPSKVKGIVESMIGNKLTTKQTPTGGVMVNKVMVAEALDISRETYFAILMDREHNGPVMVGSPQGGVDIEEVAEKNPNAIFKSPIDIFDGLKDEQALEMAKNLEFKGPQLQEAAKQIKQLYELFCKVDATQVEINPFAETPDGRVVCFDAKINFDDNAEFRQKDIFAMDDMAETDPREKKASEFNLNYIGMDGNIGCLVNGAGLAMATMDIVKIHGGEPANFLDVGGGVTEGQVLEAFKILTSDTQVKAILVNIFGGIVDCAIISSGIVKAARDIDLKVPIVARLEGSNVTEARKILAESGLPITPADSFEDAAIKVTTSLKDSAAL